jgi:hypothetical protein
LKVPQSGFLQDFDHHLDDLSIHRRRIRSDGLSADLKELSIASFLRPLPSKHRPDVIELLHTRQLVQAVLDVRTDDACGILRPQCQRSSVVIPRVHLFADDVRILTDTARE